MTRYNGTATLIAVTTTVNDDGSQKETMTETEVFCNKFTVGATVWAAAKSKGLHADSSIQMRAVDYDGQQLVRFEGSMYDVERTQNSGEFVTLTLANRISHE